MTATTRSQKATPYEQHRDYVLAVLARRCGWLDRDEREEAFHEAYAVVLEKERDGVLDLGKMSPPQVRAFLTQTAIHKALDEGKRVGRKRSVALGDTELTEPDAGRAPDELAEAGLESARVREIVGELSERRQAIVKLRFFFDRTPGEIQRLLGISERAYRRELERAQRYILERYELVREGTFCDSRRSMIMATVMGIAGPTRAREAQEHIESCPGCAAFAAELREFRRRAAALTPMPPLAMTHHGPLHGLVDVAGSLRDGLFNLGTTVKQHATAVAVRVDQASSGYVSGARPGAAAMAVAGCVTLSGGVTYCSIEGVPSPVRGVAEAVGVVAHKRHQEPKKPPVARQAAAPAPTVQPAPQPTPPKPAAPASRESSTQSRTSASKKSSTSSAPPASPAAVKHEFGFENALPPASSGSGGSAPSPAPAPPARPPGEFDP